MNFLRGRLTYGRLSAEEFGGVWHWHVTELAGQESHPTCTHRAQSGGLPLGFDWFLVWL